MDWAPQDTTVKDVIVGLLAVWGAGLSTFSFVTARRRTVRLELSAIISDAGEHISVTATNDGTRPVTIRYLTIELPDKRTLAPGHSVIPNSPLPASLADGQFCVGYFERDDVKSALRRAGYKKRTMVRGLAIDAAGKHFRGKATPMDV